MTVSKEAATLARPTGEAGFKVDKWGSKWIHGSPSSRHGKDQPIQIQAYDESTFVLRESKDISYEAPFMYLLLGDERALLLDTGATADPVLFPLRKAVDKLLSQSEQTRGKVDYSLIVAHTHGHGDHIAGDDQFRDRPNTSVVGKGPDQVRQFFKMERWPDAISNLELGRRRVDIFGIPGHHPASIAVYDRNTGMLITGDTVYPGRLYIHDMGAFIDSLERLVSFAGENGVSSVMGCHIEMTARPGRDYPIGAVYQPDEHSLQLSAGHLSQVLSAAKEISTIPGAHFFDEFAIFNGPCRTAVLNELMRGWAYNFKCRLGAFR
jgi:hydroxyacylglutathione hydrolase